MSAKLALVAALVVAGAVGLALTGPERSHAKSADEAGFTFKAELVTEGDTSAIVAVIDVAPAYHWNAEYPARVELSGELPAGLEAPTRLLKSADGGIAADRQRAKATFPVTFSGATGGEVEVRAKFSVCNERVCLMRSANAKIPVKAPR